MGSVFFHCARPDVDIGPTLGITMIIYIQSVTVLVNPGGLLVSAWFFFAGSVRFDFHHLGFDIVIVVILFDVFHGVVISV